MSARSRRIWAAALLVCYGFALALIAFWPTPVDRPVAGILLRLDAWMPGSYRALEFGSNIALFVPLGAFLALQLPRRAAWLAIIAGTVTSLAIELLQGVLLPERFAASSDVVANTIGCAVGVLLVTVARPRPVTRDA
jgi:glycopeptide antibiotics resistance protein